MGNKGSFTSLTHAQDARLRQSVMSAASEAILSANCMSGTTTTKIPTQLKPDHCGLYKHTTSTNKKKNWAKAR
jgi:hypothetical protein